MLILQGFHLTSGFANSSDISACARNGFVTLTLSKCKIRRKLPVVGRIMIFIFCWISASVVNYSFTLFLMQQVQYHTHYSFYLPITFLHSFSIIVVSSMFCSGCFLYSLYVLLCQVWQVLVDSNESNKWFCIIVPDLQSNFWHFTVPPKASSNFSNMHWFLFSIISWDAFLFVANRHFHALRIYGLGDFIIVGLCSVNVC